MATYTTNYNLKKPALADKIRIADFNGNSDTIDGAMHDNAVLGAQLKSDIGIVENTNTATHNISAGQYVIWKGDLYTASDAISSGATLSNANLTAVSGGGLNALNSKINVPDWSNPTSNICTVSNEGWTATGYGFIKVTAQWDRGGQLNINGITIYYVDKSYYGGINFHVEWLVPVKPGDIVKLIADNGTLPTSMSATFYPIR